MNRGIHRGTQHLTALLFLLILCPWKLIPGVWQNFQKRKVKSRSTQFKCCFRTLRNILDDASSTCYVSSAQFLGGYPHFSQYTSVSHQFIQRYSKHCFISFQYILKASQWGPLDKRAYHLCTFNTQVTEVLFNYTSWEWLGFSRRTVARARFMLYVNLELQHLITATSL